VTGGPGAGKTAVLGLIRKSFCEHVRVLSESAGIVFGGGFPRDPDVHDPAVVICDRGTPDGPAVHLRTPGSAGGYDHVVPLRTETADAAAVIDARILDVWARHPRRFVVDAAPDFMDKVNRTLEFIRAEVPECCRAHQNAPAAQATAT